MELYYQTKNRFFKTSHNTLLMREHRIFHLPQIINTFHLVFIEMTRITNRLHKNVLSVIMDILEMDHFREPELEEVQFFLESTGTHGSIVHENALQMNCTSSKIQSRENVLIDFKNSFPPLTNTH